MRFGTNCTGTTTLIRTGARTTCSASASLISLSESGITSQNVSVKSNGVCAIEQKLAYVRGVAAVSSGTMVKLICLGVSVMPRVYRLHLIERQSERDAAVEVGELASPPIRRPRPGRARSLVLPHHADDDALHLHLFGIDENWLHSRVGRLEANPAARIPVEFLERYVRSAQQRDDHLAVVGGFPIFDHHEIAVADLLVDHRVAPDAEDVRVALADQVFRHGDRFVGGDGLDGGTSRHEAKERQFHGADARPS